MWRNKHLYWIDYGIRLGYRRIQNDNDDGIKGVGDGVDNVKAMASRVSGTDLGFAQGSSGQESLIFCSIH